MSGKSVVAALVAVTMAAGGLVVPGALADHGSGHHKKHHGKKHKKKHHKATPTPTPTVTPVPTYSTAGKAQTATADAMAGGAFHLEYTAQRAAGAAANAATGDFTGTLTLSGNAVGNFAGPVTCLSVVGNDVGLFYPITSSSPPGLEGLNAGVYIYMTVDGKGNAVMAGFLPVPAKETNNCDPKPEMATLPATGSATATGG
jgi:hypothetical protein